MQCSGKRAARAAASSPGSLTVSGSNLCFSANDGVNGTELWAAPLAALGAVVALPYGFGCQGTAGVVPNIRRRGLPTLGNATFGISVGGIPTLLSPRPTGALLIGATRASLPLGTGCTLLVPSPITALGATFFLSPFTQTLPVPNVASLAGIELFCQWAVRDVGAANGVFSLSEGLALMIR